MLSRPSKSTIKDLSFFIGFTKIQSRIKHLGSYFGMNGHSRMDPDVILRPPESTIDFLSFFIVFRSQSSVKMKVFEKHIGFALSFEGTYMF